MSEPTLFNETPLTWDYGTAYEFFISLVVMLEPETYGVRPSWAAGIRSRIPAEERKLLEEVMPFLYIPIKWIHTLPAPKDAISVMWAARQIPARERIIQMYHVKCDDCDDISPQTLLKIAEAGSWTQDDLDQIKTKFEKYHKVRSEEALIRFLDWWVRPEELGEKFLAALQAYYQAFFEEEEKRIAPVLKQGLEHAKELSQTLDNSALLAELSQGVHFDYEVAPSSIVIAPAYWTTPLILYEEVEKGKMLFLFGARPSNMSAIPGEKVPEGLLRTLKAIADPTRLKILNYASKEETTPSELARRLNLRAPTVTHHLSELRLAGLVNLTVKGNEKFYTARREALAAAFQNLEDFLDS
jgi:DNA-binding transcriptional ArsR family regulator